MKNYKTNEYSIKENKKIIKKRNGEINKNLIEENNCRICFIYCLISEEIKDLKRLNSVAIYV